MPLIRMPFFSRAVALVCVCLWTTTQVSAASLPAGFTESVLASGLSSPTAMQFAPDGRLFVCQQGGQLRVIKNGVLLGTPFVSLNVNDDGERGLLGVAFHPNFAANRYVYVYYTTNSAPIHNRISRFTANGDVAVPGSEVVIVDLDDLSGATNHNGGAIDFGSDGKLYVAVGDNANGANAQSLSTRHGKMLRLNDNGSIPGDNPTAFAGIGGTPSGANRAIWAVGLRNPFTFALNPGGATPTMAINDVGQDTWEEINDGVAGANYGWPAFEGVASDPGATTNPRYAYDHGGGCAITGGAFYAPATTNFPGIYLNDYFFADFCAGWIRRLDTGTNSVNGFATGIDSPVDLKVADDGVLYYLARGSGAVYRVTYGNPLPGISGQPASRLVATGERVTFSVVASGAGPFTYQWQRNGNNIGGATGASYTIASAQLSDNGARFRVRVSNSGGSVFSNEAVLTVTGDQAPTPTIVQPAAGFHYTGGMTVVIAGTGTDPEDGALPPQAFSWRVDFHHDAHAHPFMPPTSGFSSGSFVVPTSGETSANVWYRIYLTVTDSGGRSRTVQRDIVPVVARVTLATSPAGLQVRLDGQPVTTPYAFDGVVGVVRTIEASEQSTGGVSYAFASWSDGGARGRTIQTPPVATTITARFATVAASGPPGTPSGLAMAANGQSVRVSWNRARGATSYQLEVGSGSGLSDLFSGAVGDTDHVERLVPPGTYSARVRALNPFGASAASSPANLVIASASSCVTPPPAPAGFTAQTGGLLVALAWQSSLSATGYLLEAGLAPGLTNLLTAGVGNGTTFTATAPAGTYYTRLRAVNACGVSGPSVEVPVALGCTAESVVPGGLTVTKAGGGATFSWLPPLGALSYRLRLGSAPGVNDLGEVDVGAVTSLGVSLAGVPPGIYFVRVAAVSACGVGTASNEVAVSVP